MQEISSRPIEETKPKEPVQITSDELALIRRCRQLRRAMPPGTIVVVEIGERLCWRVASKREGE